jgi:hypothetical protein
MKAQKIIDRDHKNLAKIKTRPITLMKHKKRVRALKIVGTNGQISLGKAYAGRSIEISDLDDGTIVIKPGHFIPDNERWLYEGDNMMRLDKAIKSAESREINYQNFEELMAKFEKRLAEND